MKLNAISYLAGLSAMVCATLAGAAQPSGTDSSHNHGAAGSQDVSDPMPMAIQDQPAGQQSMPAHSDHGVHRENTEPQQQPDLVTMPDRGMDSDKDMEMDRDRDMDMNRVTSVDPAGLRDPDAYSGGYELESGLYALESESMIKLADQTTFAGLWMDRFETVSRKENTVAELEGQAWFGNSYNRVMLRTEAEIDEGSIEEAEIDLLGLHAVSPFWNLQYGFRHQIIEDNHRHWAVLGIKGLSPYWFEVDASLFVSDHGQTLYDLEAEYEIRLSQRLVLQPRIDVHSYGKTDEEIRRGSGLSRLKLGARLRYEISRQFAPYLGVERVSSFGKSADLLRDGVDRSQNWWIAGFKFWF
ncbi:MAG: copper resistance protein B [Gammaproteobacteria bacterium]|nr:copper resistance protein B [Pseudomonadales bacterium]